MTHCYVEVARAAITSFHHPLPMVDFEAEFGRDVFANAFLAVFSISIVYSYLAIESFVNYQLYRIWERRLDGSPEANRFLVTLGDEKDFESLRLNKRIRKLGSRYKTLCHILNLTPPTITNPELWQDFKELLETARHFLVHPYPEKEYFDRNLVRIRTEAEAGKYADIAQRLIGHMYEQSGTTPPDWLSGNTLIRLRGVDLLAKSD